MSGYSGGAQDYINFRKFPGDSENQPGLGITGPHNLPGPFGLEHSRVWKSRSSPKLELSTPSM